MYDLFVWQWAVGDAVCAFFTEDEGYYEAVVTASHIDDEGIPYLSVIMSSAHLLLNLGNPARLMSTLRKQFRKMRWLTGVRISCTE